MVRSLYFTAICWLTLIIPTVLTAEDLPPTGIADDDLIKVKWLEIDATSTPLRFSLDFYVCGIEIYRCRKIKNAHIVTLKKTGPNYLGVTYQILGKHINWVIANELDKKSAHYQITAHFYRHPLNTFKALLEEIDIPYSAIQPATWKEYITTQPFDSHFDPSKYVITKFQITKQAGVTIDDYPNESTGDENPADHSPVEPLPIDPSSAAGITNSQYEAIIQSVEKIFIPLAREKNVNLKFIRNWSDPTEDAISGYQEDASGKIYTVSFPGGLARAKTMNEEAYTAVVCHEIAHHLGGNPTFPNGSSVEGQSDYFGAYDCLRRVIVNQGQLFNKNYMPQVPKLVTFFCQKAFNDPLNTRLCQLISYYGLQINQFFARKKGLPLPRFETPSLQIATKYYEVGEDPHPPLQCRLDAYFAAALCNNHPLSTSLQQLGKDYPDPQTPVIDSQVKAMVFLPLQGIDVCRRNENFVLGERPVCWFIPDY